MHQIDVHTTGAQEASDGVVELWRDGEQIPYTHYHPRDGSWSCGSTPAWDGAPAEDRRA